MFPVGPGGSSGAAHAQEVDAASKAVPLGVVHIASVEHLLSDADAMFAAAGRPDLSETMGVGLAAIGNLGGLDRDKPLGVMVFLPSDAIIPQPKVVGFIPVQNLESFIATVERGPIQFEKIAELENRYEIVVPQRDPLQALHRGEYLFVAANDTDLEFDFPNPVTVTNHLSSRYDMAASLNLAGVPKSLKEIFLDFFRASVESELQRRDDESEGSHRIRKARGASTLESVELLLTEGEELTIGWAVSTEKRDAHLELVVKAAPDSEFAKRLVDIGGRNSHFSALLDAPVPLTISSSWVLDTRGQETLKETIAGAQAELTARLAEPGGNPGRFDELFKPLLATAERGHMDFFAQFIALPPDKVVLVGGAKIADSTTLAKGLSDLLGQLRDRPQLSNLEMRIGSHQGVTFHRLVGNQSDARQDRMYGGKPALYVGAGEDVLWFAVGGDDALPTLKSKMDLLAEQPDSNPNRRTDAPFQFTVHLQQWLALFGQGGNRGPVVLAREAFADGNDVLRIDIRPTETGARFRIELEEGFVRLVGLAVARRIDGRLNR